MPPRKKLPPESLPRRSPTGGFEPITIHINVTWDGVYRLRDLVLRGRKLSRDLEDLKDAVRAYYTGRYISTHRRRRPQDPPPSPTDDIFQFEFVVDRSKQRPQEPVIASPPTGNCITSPSTSGIWERDRPGWGFGYYIRIDRGGSYHTYPYAGGPFQSLEEVDKAMDRYFHELRDPKLLMNQGGAPSLEISIEKSLYWPDGRRRKRSRSYLIQQARNRMRRLLQALVDKYNEDHSLLGDLAYELKDVVNCQTICEQRIWYYHLNFRMTKGAGDSNCGIENLFFAEVKNVRQGKEKEMLVSGFCMVEPTDSGHCYGCTKGGNVDMKHPSSVGEYLGGHLNVPLQYAYYNGPWSDSDDEDGVADPKCMEMFTLPPSAFDDD